MNNKKAIKLLKLEKEVLRLQKKVIKILDKIYEEDELLGEIVLDKIQDEVYLRS